MKQGNINECIPSPFIKAMHTLNHEMVRTFYKYVKHHLVDAEELELFQAFDRVMTMHTGKPFHSCPICGEVLAKDVTGFWKCSGESHGDPIYFMEGKKSCSHMLPGGPFCGFEGGYCLEKSHVHYGNPSICRIGRVDVQSPE